MCTDARTLGDGERRGKGSLTTKGTKNTKRESKGEAGGRRIDRRPSAEVRTLFDLDERRAAVCCVNQNTGRGSRRSRFLGLGCFVNRKAMASTSPGRQSGETAKSGRHRVPKGRQDDSDKAAVVPAGLWGVCCFLDHGLASRAVTCHAFGIQNCPSLALRVSVARVSAARIGVAWGWTARDRVHEAGDQAGWWAGSMWSVSGTGAGSVLGLSGPQKHRNRAGRKIRSAISAAEIVSPPMVAKM